jgi:hypothetical protein
VDKFANEWCDKCLEIVAEELLVEMRERVMLGGGGAEQSEKFRFTFEELTRRAREQTHAYFLQQKMPKEEENF